MSITSRIGRYLESSGKQLVQKELEAQYGQQIGKVAKNGSRAFQRQVGNTTVITGLNWDNKVIAEVTKKEDTIGGTTKKIRFNSDGDMVAVSHSRRATNFRNNVTENIETGEVKSKVLDIGAKDGKPQYQVTTTKINKSGKVTSSVKDVKIKGKNNPIEQV